MEIPELNIISDFAAGMNRLQNPSLFSQIFSVSGTGKVPQMFRLWQLGALILALFATFSGIITRIKLLIARFCKDKLVASLGPPTQNIDDDDEEEEYDDDEEEEEESCSSASSSDDEDDDLTTSFEDDPQPVDEDFCVLGSGFCCEGGNRRDCGVGHRRLRSGGDRCSWSEFGIGKSVVKLWDSLGLGLGLNFCEDESGSVVSIWDVNEDRELSSFSGGRRQIQAVAMSSPAVFLSAGSKSNGSVLLGVHDLRAGGRVPALFSEWMRRRGKVVGIDSCGGEKVYVMDDVSGWLTVGDLRNTTAPLENITECYGDCGLECWRR